MPPITAAPNPGTATVTSDSSEYCQHLSGRVDGLARDAKPPPPAEVAGLAREGQRLCEDGKTRSGILHLRRAFIMLRHPDAER